MQNPVIIMNRTISCYNATVTAATVQRFFSTEKRRFRFCAILLPSSALNLAHPPNTTQPPLSSIFKKEVAVLRRGSEIPRSPTLLRCHHESKLLSLVKNGGTFCSLVFNFITLANFKLKPADCLPIFTAFFFRLLRFSRYICLHFARFAGGVDVKKKCAFFSP